MAAAFAALRNDRTGAHALHQACHADGCHDRDNLNAGRKPVFHIFGGVTRAGRYDRHFFLRDHLCHLVRERAHQHDVHTKGLIGQFSCNFNLLAQVLCVCVHSGNNAKAARFGNGAC